MVVIYTFCKQKYSWVVIASSQLLDTGHNPLIHIDEAHPRTEEFAVHWAQLESSTQNMGPR